MSSPSRFPASITFLVNLLMYSLSCMVIKIRTRNIKLKYELNFKLYGSWCNYRLVTDQWMEQSYFTDKWHVITCNCRLNNEIHLKTSYIFLHLITVKGLNICNYRLVTCHCKKLQKSYITVIRDSCKKLQTKYL